MLSCKLFKVSIWCWLRNNMTWPCSVMLWKLSCVTGKPNQASPTTQRSSLLSPVESYRRVHRGTTPSFLLLLAFAFVQAQMIVQHRRQDDEEGVMNIKNPHRPLSLNQSWASSSSWTESYEEPLGCVYLVTYPITVTFEARWKFLSLP